jgi:hypothetical protein
MGKDLGLYNNLDFSEIDMFSKRGIKDLRNRREHVVGYFKGDTIPKDRWYFETPEYDSEAGSRVDDIIGGWLDYIKFSTAAGQLLSNLLKEPIPASVR